MRCLFELCRNLILAVARAQRVTVPVDRALGEEVDHALERILCTDRNLERDRIRVEPIADHANDVLEVRTDAIHLVHEGDPGNFVAICLTPHLL